MCQLAGLQGIHISILVVLVTEMVACTVLQLIFRPWKRDATDCYSGSKAIWIGNASRANLAWLSLKGGPEMMKYTRAFEMTSCMSTQVLVRIFGINKF